jgi:hypothetical protein
LIGPRAGVRGVAEPGATSQGVRERHGPMGWCRRGLLILDMAEIKHPAPLSYLGN